MKFGLPIRLLLCASFVLTAGRALVLPFLAIYLTRSFALKPAEVGSLLAGSLSVAAVAGVYGGYLVDRSDKRRLMIAGVLVAAAFSALFPVVRSQALAVLCLTAANCAVSLVDIAVKSAFAKLLDADSRGKAFSARYLVNNIAYAAAPMVGAAIAPFGDRLLFLCSAALCGAAIVPLALLACDRAALGPQAASASFGFRRTLAAVRADRQLLVFTLAGVLCAIVYGRFSAYLSQYLIVVADTATAYRTVGLVVTVNALLVMGLQYPIGARVERRRLLAWQATATALFVVGLLGYMRASSLPAWLAATVPFTIAEIVIVPASYLFIDHIAPEHLKGAYYGVQSLANLGSAASPFLCGLCLATGHPASMFWMLVAACVASLALYALGERAPAAMPAGA